ncbi:MAG: alpha/beta hydrolase [Alphaproteobacteria bacterium]|nr:alpha/beta hydrolase [Alphaproteobacteria bacterium]
MPASPTVSRRATLAGLATLLASGPALAQGPKVWLDLDQKALDDAYDQAVYAPNLQQIIGRYATNSEAVRARLGAPQRLAYGPSAIEALDLYRTDKPNAPVQIFIHGGAWRTGLAKDYAFPAELFVRAGAHFVVPDFINVLEADGSLMPMAEQVRRAIAWVARNAGSFGGDPERLYLSGHSSGAHLAGVALIGNESIKGALLCSGMYDLKPARLSARSKYVAFTDAMEDALSTQRHLARIACPVILAHGTKETPEFIRQTRDFAAALKAAGKPVELLVADGYNHFEVIETLANPYGLLGRAALAQMNLAAA